MSSKETILTAEGLKKLEDELENLRSVRRHEVAERIKVAIGYGDISENSEYDDAKNEQSFVEGRILELEAQIRTAVVIQTTKSNHVAMASTVRIRDEKTNEEETVTIVGSTEADPFEGKISNDSPVGRALLGTKAGDEVEVDTPAGVIKYKVLEISGSTNK